MLGTTAQGPDIDKGAGSLDPCRHVLAQEEKRLPLAAGQEAPLEAERLPAKTMAEVA